MNTTILSLTVQSALGWTNPNNSLASDNAYATFTDTGSPGNNSYFRFNTNASSVLPAGITILGVVAQVEYRASNTSTQPRISAGPGYFGGPMTNDVFVTTADAFYAFGSTTNPLEAVTVSDLAVAAVRFGKEVTGTVTYYLDFVRITVYWDYSSNLNGGSVLFFGENF